MSEGAEASPPRNSLHQRASTGRWCPRDEGPHGQDTHGLPVVEATRFGAIRGVVPATIREQLLARCGQDQVAADPIEQLEAELLFELADGATARTG
jgi:hypothetical protein